MYIHTCTHTHTFLERAGSKHLKPRVYDQLNDIMSRSEMVFQKSFSFTDAIHYIYIFFHFDMRVSHLSSIV